jgi:hypothetical protein
MFEDDFLDSQQSHEQNQEDHFEMADAHDKGQDDAFTMQSYSSPIPSPNSPLNRF